MTMIGIMKMIKLDIFSNLLVSILFSIFTPLKFKLWDTKNQQRYLEHF